uniref:PDZ domain-containing protein n=1 Tax=Callorhinchus milii TaxID=7868 RepID=A0A4W3GNR0_CALMI
MRILEVNNHSLLGMTHTEAVRILRGVGDTLHILVCQGFDPKLAATLEASPGIIANPFAAGMGRKNSMESISSIDRDMSPEEMDILQKELEMVRESAQWEREELEKVERMRREREESNRLLEEETEVISLISAPQLAPPSTTSEISPDYGTTSPLTLLKLWSTPLSPQGWTMGTLSSPAFPALPPHCRSFRTLQLVYCPAPGFGTTSFPPSPSPSLASTGSPSPRGSNSRSLSSPTRPFMALLPPTSPTYYPPTYLPVPSVPLAPVCSTSPAQPPYHRCPLSLSAPRLWNSIPQCLRRLPPFPPSRPV